MRTIAIVLIGLSTLGFFLAALTALVGTSVVGVAPEGFSRGCSNLALIAIALAVWFRNGNKTD